MAHWDISGSWVGDYWWDSWEGFPEEPPPVRFTLTARAGWFGRFRGSAQDDPTAMPEGQAKIAGRVAGRTVKFKKWYRAVLVGNPGSVMTFGEYMEREHGIPVDRDVRSPPILYRGEYDLIQGTAAGSWLIPEGQITFYSRGQIMTVPWPPTEGGWRMRREFG